MVSLPSSIETYLQEAGFTTTELLVLKRLLEGETLTLRELASKTGKSTGVLDQATKKLMERRIVTKESINDTSKYAITSIDTIQQWMQKDMKQRHEVLERKRIDFEAFISTVQHQSDRPEMEYFEGLMGIQQAFAKLLEKNEREWLHFIPANSKEEEDPLVEFRVSLFRERRRQKTFMRVLCPDVALGRRYQTRDVFEYRDTRLVEAADFPVAFEQFIVGDTVACIDIAQQKASFIRFPDLASSQRKIFEMLWCQAGKNCTAEECAACAGNTTPQTADMETKIFSGIREFFLGKTSIVAFAILGFAAAAMTWGLYENNLRMNIARYAERSVAIATTTAPDFDGDALDRLRNRDDMSSEDYQNAFDKLNQIKDRNKEVAYIYILRPNADTTQFEWIVDADSNIDIPFIFDSNEDGILNDADEGIVPGQKYDVSNFKEFESKIFTKPITSKSIQTDQWGSFITSYAPILNSKGEVAGLLGVDYWANDVKNLTSQSFNPIIYFFIIFLVFVFIRLVVFYKPLSKEIYYCLRTKRVFVSLCICIAAAGIVTFWIYQNVSNVNTERVRDRVKAIAATAAPEFNSSEISLINKYTDVDKEIYKYIVTQLQNIRNRNPEIEYVYLMRKTDNPYFFEFIADADSMYLKDKDGLLDNIVMPGQLWLENYPDDSPIHEVYITKKPAADKTPTVDEWGTWISGHAPIFDDNGDIEAVLGVDMLASKVDKLTKNDFNFFNSFIVFTALLIVMSFITIFISKYNIFK